MREELAGHLPALRRFAHGLAGNRADAEDLLQDCLAQAVAREKSWRGGNLRAWLLAIMVNRFRNGLRAARRRPALTPLDDVEIAAADALPDPLANRRLHAALDSLAPESRAVVMLVVLEEMSYAETAQVLGIPIGTVMSRLSRARRQMAEMLARDNIVSLRR